MKRSALVFVVMMAVIGAVLWAGFRNLQQRRRTMQAKLDNQPMLMSDVPKDGVSGPAMDTSGGTESPLKGKPAPAFALMDLAGRKVSLADYKGRPVVVNFWATWCGPCKVEMPWFEEFTKKYAADRFEVLGLTDDADAGKDVIGKAASKLGVTYPVLLTDGVVQKSYGDPEVLPMSFYVDKTGKVVAVTAGLGTKDELEARVKDVIAAGGQ